MSRKSDRAWQEYSVRFRGYVLPKLLDSRMFLSINTTADGDFDVQQATEFGAAMLLGKPIAIVVPKGHSAPECIRRAADFLFEDYDISTQEGQDRFAEFIKEVAAKTGFERSNP